MIRHSGIVFLVVKNNHKAHHSLCEHKEHSGLKTVLFSEYAVILFQKSAILVPLTEGQYLSSSWPLWP